jgi:hypothetical protein
MWKMIESQIAMMLTDSANNFRLMSIVGVWYATTAINRITLTPYAGNFVEHTVASLYGLS